MTGLANRTRLFGSCITRLSSIRAAAAGAINLAQGFPEHDPPHEVLQEAVNALKSGRNQYADMRGLGDLRKAVAEHRQAFFDSNAYDPDAEVTVTCGATEAMAAAILAIVEPGDEVLVQEPAYENYGPQIILAGGHPRHFRLDGDNRLTAELLRTCIGKNTKAIILNTPNNPSGRVFDRLELSALAKVCHEHGLYVLSDEVYDHLAWDDHVHLSPAIVGQLRERTVVIESMSKTWAATGWRVGWAIAPRELTAAIRRAHDFLTGCAPTASQHAAVVALRLDRSYYASQKTSYEARRELLGKHLRESGLQVENPQGAYYFFADTGPWGFADSELAADALLREAKVGVVPWRAFFADPSEVDRRFARFNFAKSLETLEVAGRRVSEFGRSRL